MLDFKNPGDTAQVNIKNHTKNLNAEIDRWKKSETKNRRAISRKNGEDKREAQALLKRHWTELLAYYAHIMKQSELKKSLKRMAWFHPVTFTNLVERFLKEKHSKI